MPKGPRPLRSTPLARLAGVSPDTLRHYERKGLLPKAARSGRPTKLPSSTAST